PRSLPAWSARGWRRRSHVSSYGSGRWGTGLKGLLWIMGGWFRGSRRSADMAGGGAGVAVLADAVPLLVAGGVVDGGETVVAAVLLNVGHRGLPVGGHWGGWRSRRVRQRTSPRR